MNKESANGKILFSDIFSDGMVLQRDMSCSIHGTGVLPEEFEVVLVNSDGCVENDNFMEEFLTVGPDTCDNCIDYETLPNSCEPADGNINIYAIKEEHWEIFLKPHTAGGPYTIRICFGGDYGCVEIRDVLFGDVWLAGGQSNMDFVLKDSLGAEEEMNKPGNDLIRYFRVPSENRFKSADDPKRMHAGWIKTGEKELAEITAVGHYFAEHIFRTCKAEGENVPIGIVDCNWGGTSVTAWMDMAHLDSVPEAHVYMDEYKEYMRSNPPETYAKMVEDYEKSIQDWLDKYRDVIESGGTDEEAQEAVGPYPWLHPLAALNEFAPTRLFGTMLSTVAPYGLKGAIYYQGETDTQRHEFYFTLFTTMIDNWREIFRNPKLPMLIVQIANFEEDNGVGPDWAYLRDIQMSVWKRVPYTATAVITDSGEQNDIHPKDKKTVGERLALLADKYVYGKDDAGFVFSGPVYKDYRVVANQITIEFDLARDGLELRKVNEEDKGDSAIFEICGADGVYHEAQASIDEDAGTITLLCDAVEDPVHARYAWRNWFVPVLFNRSGIPASGFNTECSEKGNVPLKW